MSTGGYRIVRAARRTETPMAVKHPVLSPRLTLSGGRRPGACAADDSVQADGHPNYVDEGRRVRAIPAAIEDETGAREDVQPLIKPRSRTDPAHCEQQVGRQ